MKTKIEHQGWIDEKGDLHLSNKKRFKEGLSTLKKKDVTVLVKVRGKASSASRRYYFGIVVPEITAKLRELGNDVDEELVHGALKLKFNKEYVRDPDGVVLLEAAGTTTVHNVEERSEFIEACVRFAAESLGIHISPPSTQTDIKFE
ncbi:MAG: hypothetical protein NVS1B13_19220 [Flavisolibacter sp.]